MSDDRLSISVVIPVLDDVQPLSRLLGDLGKQRGIELDIVVVDGGSEDEPRDIVRACGARMVRSGRGRGRQMNRGAMAAKYDRLLFLHADSRLPDSEFVARAIDQWRHELAASDSGQVAGRFRLRFRCDGGDCGPQYRFLEEKTGIDRNFVFNGDQGLLIGRDFFEQLGRFDESLPFLEDQRLGRKIDACGRWVIFEEWLSTSARRFEKEGFGRRYLLMSMIMGAFAGGVDEFFERMPEIYKSQRHTELLPVGEYLVELSSMLADMESKRRREVLMRVGRFVRQNAWQLPLMMDVVCDTDHRWLGWYERHLESRLDRRSLDFVAGALALGLFAGVLPAAAWVGRTSELDLGWSEVM